VPLPGTLRAAPAEGLGIMPIAARTLTAPVFGGPPFSRGDQALTALALGKALGDPADPAERVRTVRGHGGDFQQAFILQQALPRHVDPLRLPLPPAGGGPEQAQQAAVVGAGAQPLPHGVRVGAIGRGLRQDRHLRLHPRDPALFSELVLQPLIDSAKVGDVCGGVGDLGRAQGTGGPIAEAVRLVDLPTGQCADERVIADLIAKSGHHGGDLRVEDRGGDDAEQMQEDFHVLPGGMEHLDARRLRVDHRGIGGAAELDDAELGEIGPFPHELRVDRDIGFGLQTGAERGQGGGFGDEDGCGKNGWRSGHRALLTRVTVRC